jgi:hypothetical protein
MKQVAERERRIGAADLERRAEAATRENHLRPRLTLAVHYHDALSIPPVRHAHAVALGHRNDLKLERHHRSQYLTRPLWDERHAPHRGRSPITKLWEYANMQGANANDPDADASFAAALQRFVEHALQDPTLELELAVDFPVSANMFRALVRELARRAPPDESVQVGVPYKNVRFEYVGEDSVRKCLSGDPAATPTCVVMKGRETPVIRNGVYPYVARLKRETVVTEEYAQKRIDTLREFRLKRRLSFRFDPARVDCTIVQRRGSETAPDAHIPLMTRSRSSS